MTDEGDKKPAEEKKPKIGGGGGGDKCHACGKTVYPMDRLGVDGSVFHKRCFKCEKCHMSLTTSNYACSDGHFFCKPHYQQMVKEKGSVRQEFSKSDSKKEDEAAAKKKAEEEAAKKKAEEEAAKKKVEEEEAAAKKKEEQSVKKEVKPKEEKKTSNPKIGGGGGDNKCHACGKTVYPMDRLGVDGSVFHKRCFKCEKCHTSLTTSNYACSDGHFFCKPHYQQMVKEKGSSSKQVAAHQDFSKPDSKKEETAKKKEEEAAKKAEEEAKKKEEEEATAKKKAEEEAKKKEEEEAAAKKKEEEAAKKAEEEARKKEEEEAAAKKKAEEEAAKKKAEEEAVKKKEEEEAAAKKKEEEEAAKKAEEEAAKKKAEEEAKKKEEEEAAAKKKEEEEAAKKAEEEAAKKAEEEAKKKEEEEAAAKKKEEEEAAKKKEEEEAKKKEEEEAAAKKKEEEAAKKKAEEEAAKKAEEEAAKKKAEEEAAKKKEEEEAAAKKKEEEAKKKAEEEAAKKKEEEEAAKKKAEEEAAKKKAEQSAKEVKPKQEEKKPSTTSNLKIGGGGGDNKCNACGKTVYPMDRVSVDGTVFHKRCFKCEKCHMSLTTSNYACLDGHFFCKPHYQQMVKEKGSSGESKKEEPLKSSPSDSEEEAKRRAEADAKRKAEEAAAKRKEASQTKPITQAKPVQKAQPSKVRSLAAGLTIPATKPSTPIHLSKPARNYAEDEDCSMQADGGMLAIRHSVALPLTPEASGALREFKEGSFNFAAFCITNNKINIEKKETVVVSSLSDHYNSTQPRFYLLETDLSNGQHHIFFIYSCPEKCPPRQRMVYSTAKSCLVEEIEHAAISVTRKIEVSSVGDLSPQELERSVSGPTQEELNAKEVKPKVQHPTGTNPLFLLAMAGRGIPQKNNGPNPNLKKIVLPPRVF